MIAIFRSVFLAALLLAAAPRVATAQSIIFLVRHAEKAAPVPPDNKDPELSKLGIARADSLGQTLKDADLKAVFATELKRSQQTAAAVATAIGLPVTTVPAADSAALISRLKETRGNALVVGHSNTLPEIIRARGATTAVTISDDVYDDLFVLLMTSPPQLLRLHYR